MLARDGFLNRGPYLLTSRSFKYEFWMIPVLGTTKLGSNDFKTRSGLLIIANFCLLYLKLPKLVGSSEYTIGGTNSYTSSLGFPLFKASASKIN